MITFNNVYDPKMVFDPQVGIHLFYNSKQELYKNLLCTISWEMLNCTQR